MNRYNNRKTNNDFYYAVDDVEIYNQVVEDFKAVHGEDNIEECLPLLKKKAEQVWQKKFDSKDS